MIFDLFVEDYKMDAIIGRAEEKKTLAEMLVSKEAELIALYGRRRDGKTFLVRNFYHKHMVFEFTGENEASLAQQLTNFSTALKEAMGTAVPPATTDSWQEALSYLPKK